jgi:uncharacterized NAD(P)/FAD-binding protein YdhS
MSAFIDAQQILKIRDELHQRTAVVRHERNWLNDHNHKIEAMVKTELADELDKVKYRLEDLLDKVGVKYHY